MNHIYCIIGKSGTGKDTVLEEILKNVKINKLVPYTTRPMREVEVNGGNYHFVSKDEFIKMDESGLVIEKRFYDTVHGEWIYFTAVPQDTCDRDYIIITTQEAIPAFFEAFGEDRVHVIYLRIDDKLRLERCINRESMQDTPNYMEVCRRFIADEGDFDEKKICSYKNVTVIDTSKPLYEYTKTIVDVILSNR